MEGVGEGSLIKYGNMVQAIAQIHRVVAIDMVKVPREKKTIARKNVEKRQENGVNGGNETMGLLGPETLDQKMGCKQALGVNHTFGQNT